MKYKIAICDDDAEQIAYLLDLVTAWAQKNRHLTVQIVFITGFYGYFSDGFDVSVLHYLIKPADAAKLYPVLDKAVNNLAYRQRSVLISTADGDFKVSLGT